MAPSRPARRRSSASTGAPDKAPIRSSSPATVAVVHPTRSLCSVELEDPFFFCYPSPLPLFRLLFTLLFVCLLNFGLLNVFFVVVNSLNRNLNTRSNKLQHAN